MHIAIAGVGYVGLVTAACLAQKGHEVTCTDIDMDKLRMLSMGQAPFFEPGLTELLQKYKERLFYAEQTEAYRSADLIFICVGTPEKVDGSANLKYVCECARQIAENLQNDCVVVLKSTVPIGTNDKVERIISENLKHEVSVQVASNPEFLSQGTAIRDTLEAARIVIGVESQEAEKVLKEAYESFHLPILVTDRRSAEMVKYASNDFLALKISYINEIANICELVGANVEDISKGMGMDPRIGTNFLMPGVGYGGSCFPKDTKALHWLARYHDYEIKTIKAAIEVNENQKIKLIKKAKKYYEKFDDLTVAILGVTFKPETDDLRDAPALTTISLLLESDSRIKVWDPVGLINLKKLYPTELEYCADIESTLTEADICFIFTEWSQIKQFAPAKFKALMKAPIVLDGRNCFSPQIMEAAGVSYESIGRRPVHTELRLSNYNQ